VKGEADVELIDPTRLTLHKHWEKPREIDLPQNSGGGHGGADALMLRDIFDPDGKDPLGRRATFIDAARSVLTGIAANFFLKSGRREKIEIAAFFRVSVDADQV
jgi:hypothetical protein